MDAGVQERIFDPFFTTKEKGRGTGLGLYIVRTLVRRLGGRVRVYDREERSGTIFEVQLPGDSLQHSHSAELDEKA
jgi:signal transduction histidine kinase